MARRWRTTALALGIAGALALGAAACGDDDEAATVPTLLTFSYEGTTDPDALEAAISARLAPIGIGVGAVDAGTPGEVTVALEDERVDELAADLLAQQGVVRFRPVLKVEEGEPSGVAPTPAAQDLPDQEVVLVERDGSGEVTSTYRLGPTVVDGGVESARAQENAAGTWDVALVLRQAAGAELNDAAAACFAEAPACPTGQLAIVVDGTVLTAPSISQPSYERDQVVISGGDDWDAVDARRLARVLEAGPLPVALTATDG